MFKPSDLMPTFSLGGFGTARLEANGPLGANDRARFEPGGVISVKGPDRFGPERVFLQDAGRPGTFSELGSGHAVQFRQKQFMAGLTEEAYRLPKIDPLPMAPTPYWKKKSEPDYSTNYSFTPAIDPLATLNSLNFRKKNRCSHGRERDLCYLPHDFEL